jgi:hypothetical protein
VRLKGVGTQKSLAHQALPSCTASSVLEWGLPRRAWGVGADRQQRPLRSRRGRWLTAGVRRHTGSMLPLAALTRRSAGGACCPGDAAPLSP